ncbi:MAG: N-acetylmuramoyl-L-alanine amidase [Kiritimatiellia bacterium]
MRGHLPFFILPVRHCLLLLLALFALRAPAALVLKDDYRSPRNKERPFRKSTRLIVLHTTEAHAKSALNKLSERGEAHYCVTEAGEAYRIIDRDREAFHAGRSMWNAKEDCDEFSVGIEVVGYHNQTMPLKQLEALKELVGRLKKIYGIPDARVVCHSHVAYGSPNTWHKQKHRGRKRCGMLFAMPSVRAKLGLKARPAYDPDVKAKRLTQADSYLNSVLYGGVDTMAVFYGKPLRPQIAAAPKKPAPAKPSASRAVAAQKPAKPSAAKPRQSPPARKPQEEAPKPAPAEEESDWMTAIGLKGGYFKKKAKLVLAASAVETNAPPLPLPKGLHIAKMGDDVKDLAALAKLPGYARGGPVSASLSPFKIAGTAWKAPTTYYYSPGGKITTGDKIDEKAIEAGTFVFYRK